MSKKQTPHSDRWVRELYIHDNLPVLRGLADNSVDLIYLDPPFNSKKAYKAPIGTAAEGQMFDDTWRWNDLDDVWLGEIDRRCPDLVKVIIAVRALRGDGDAAYATMMGVRLIQLRRVLKPHGSIYLHCDDTATHLLRLSMDAVFKSSLFRNTIIWRRYGSHNDTAKFGRVCDHLHYYAPHDRTWNPPTVPLNDLIDDIPSVSGKEAIGWRTQKPLKLIQLLIKASSNSGDLVLDPFCGCATACVAAEIEGRQWIGIDTCKAADDIARVRLHDTAMDWEDNKLHVLREPLDKVASEEIMKDQKEYRMQEAIDRLYGSQRGECASCGYLRRVENLHIAYIRPRDEGGDDNLLNLQLLCASCNATTGTGPVSDLWNSLTK